MAILTDGSGNNLVDENGVALTDDLPSGASNALTALLVGSAALRALTIERARALATFVGAGSFKALVTLVSVPVATMIVHFRHKRN